MLRIFGALILGLPVAGCIADLPPKPDPIYWRFLACNKELCIREGRMEQMVQAEAWTCALPRREAAG